MSVGTSPRWLPPCVLGAALTAVAIWLRVPPLNPRSLWLDDLWVIAPSRATSVGDVIDMMVTAPGFSALANLLPWVAGPESWAAQALPFAAGVAAPGVALAVGRWMGWGWPASAVAATVMVVAPEHLLYSTRVKQYTLEALIGVVLIGLAWRVLERRSSPWTLVAAAAAATTVSGSAGSFAGAMAAATFFIAAVTDRRRFRDLIRPVASYAGFIALWWLLYLRSHVPEGLRSFWQDDFLTVGDGPSAFLLDLRRSLARTAQGFLPVDSAWLWLGLALLVVTLWAPRLAALLLAPVLAAVAMAALQQAPLGAGRTEIYLLPAAAFAAGGAVRVVGQRSTRWATPASRGAAVGLCAALLFGVQARGVRDEPYPQHDVRGYIEAAEAELSDPDSLVLVYPATRWAWAVYGPGTVEPVARPSSPTGFDVVVGDPGVHVLSPHRDDASRYAAEIAAAVQGRSRVVFIASHWRSDIAAIEAWFPAHGWVEADRQQANGGRRVEYRAP